MMSVILMVIVIIVLLITIMFLPRKSNILTPSLRAEVVLARCCEWYLGTSDTELGSRPEIEVVEEQVIIVYS